jgi:hypothetical protein
MANIINQYGQVKVGVRVQSSGSSGGGIDADAQAFITAASITDTTQQSAINTLVTQLKTYGIWTKLKAVYPFVGGTATTHKFNLKDPRDLSSSFRLIFNGGGTHSSTGYKPNGNAYAQTWLNPSNDLTNNNYHLSHYSRDQITTGNSVDMGCSDGATTYMIGLTHWYEGLNAKGFVAGDFNKLVASTNNNTLGLHIGSRTSTTFAKMYMNGIQTGNELTTANLSGLINRTMVIGGQQTAGGVAEYSTRQCAFASIGDGLTDAEAANFYTAVQTFQTTLGRNVGAPIVSDTDAQAFLNAAEITSQIQANAIDVLVTDLKSANIWTKMKALYPFVGGTASSHKFNLKDPRDLDAAYRLVFNGGWTHSSNGAQPNGTTAFADTKLIPSSTLSLNSTHLSVYLNTNYSGPGSTDVVDMGVEDASYTNRLFIEPSTNGNVYSINNSNGYSYINTSDSNSLGLYVNNRISSTAINLFKNNIKLINDTARISSGLSVRPLYIGAHNFVGSASYLSSRRQAFASMGDGLTDAEAAAFYTAVQKYQTSLGRQV